VVDTTGAGDAFVGAMLWQLRGMSLEEMGELLAFSNAAGTIVATKKGAIPAMPDLDTINTFMRQFLEEK